MHPGLDHEQWERFVRRDWCRRVTWRRGLGALVSSRELFDVVAAASSAGDGRTQFRQYANARPVDGQSLLPRPDDGSFTGWRRRMARRFRGSVALVVNPLQHHSHGLWQRLSEFLRGLFERTGIPAYGVEVGAFIGDYDATPFGVHTDAVDVIASMIEGRKRIVTWRPEQLTQKQAELYGRSAALPRPRAVDANPGDLVYWPSGFWHIAQCRGFSVSLN